MFITSDFSLYTFHEILCGFFQKYIQRFFLDQFYGNIRSQTVTVLKVFFIMKYSNNFYIFRQCTYKCIVYILADFNKEISLYMYINNVHNN